MIASYNAESLYAVISRDECDGGYREAVLSFPE